MPFMAALPAITGIASALGSIFGGGAKGSSDARNQQNQLQAIRDRTEVDKYGTAQNAQMQLGGLDLQRKGFEEDARGGRAKQALIGSLLQNFQPSQVNVPGITPAKVSGGLGQALQGQGQQVGGLLFQQALMKMLGGPEQFQGGQILQAPRATPLKEAGGLEKILGLGGLIGSTIGGVGSVLPQKPKMPGEDVGFPQIP